MDYKSIFFFKLAIGVLIAVNVTAATATMPVATIDALDVQRYMGTWHEIAKFPNWFQRKCAGQTRAQYSALPNGDVQVFNSCTTAEAKTMDATGLAKQVGGANSPKLKVRFAPEWLAWLPWVWGEYWVIDLDPQYQLAAVSDSKREYLWVLSRTPQVEATAYNALLTRLKAQGFETHRLELTPQLEKGNP